MRIALVALALVGSGLTPDIQDHPWTGPPAILISGMKGHTPRFMYNTTSVVSDEGRFVAWYRWRKDYPPRLILRNIKREHNRVVVRPDDSYRWNDTRYGKVRSYGYRPPMFTPDGRYLVFATEYRVIPSDRNNYSDVYRFDRKTGESILVSAGDDGRPADSESTGASISADGRFVAFTSGATDLVPDDTNDNADVFVRDLAIGTTQRVSLADDESQSSRSKGYDGWDGFPSYDGSISADGSRVAFLSYADNLVEDDTNNAADAFVRDLEEGTTTRVSVTSSGDQLEPYEYAESASSFRDGAEQVALSGNGEVVVFRSHANGLVPDDENNNLDIFTHEIATGITERVSEPTGGGDAYGEESKACGDNGQCFYSIGSSNPSISFDGDRVFFLSGGPHMTDVDEDKRNDIDAFVHDRSSRITQLINRRPDGSWASTANMYAGSISSDGNWVTYGSDAPGIAPGDKRAYGDVFLQQLDDASFGD